MAATRGVHRLAEIVDHLIGDSRHVMGNSFHTSGGHTEVSDPTS